nr:hypothetical protein [Escherichia coli]
MLKLELIIFAVAGIFLGPSNITNASTKNPDTVVPAI